MQIEYDSDQWRLKVIEVTTIIVATEAALNTISARLSAFRSLIFDSLINPSIQNVRRTQAFRTLKTGKSDKRPLLEANPNEPAKKAVKTFAVIANVIIACFSK